MNILPFNEKLDKAIPLPYDASDSVNEFELKEKIIHACKVLYTDFDMSVRDICNVFGCEYNPELQKVFYRLCGSKNKGVGGNRPNRKKVLIDVSLSLNEIMNRYDLPKATAWRSKQRGYFYKS